MNLNVTKNAMRGLTVFISDLRNAQSKENEEKRVTKEMAHIRKEFKDNKGIDGYQRRKYVCKLLYIYMLGYDLDFGHMEAVTLISSNKYQEKLIGYIALGMLLHENHEMVPLLINSLQEDLQARSDFFQCLALSGIGNIGGKEMAESLAPVVQKLLIASTSPPVIKKRAALALLRLYRKYPSLITPDLWGEKLIAILDDNDLGVLTAVTSLLLGLVAENSEGWDVAIPKVVGILGKVVITREYTKEYVYYSVPNPWLQTKLLRFLRHFPPPTTSSVASRLYEILNVIFASADAAKAGTVNHKNALNAVLFEAINLVIHHDSDQNLLRQTGSLLGRFISAKETNIRYLGLEAMSHLASLSTETSNMVKKYQETVIASLRDADISIRRRALDLLYGMCDKTSSKAIVAELLTYLVSADYAIREELVLKIANLAEKFASNYSWYVDVVLQLISLAGDFVSDDIWHRVIKIVTNHEDIQEYAARHVFKALQSPTCHETTVKVGGYILGEFGHLISDKDANASPQAQLQTLHTKFPTCGLATRAMLLSTYAKFVNLFPELTRQLQDIFNQHRSFIDTEIQQRACEYYNLSSLNDEELIQTVLDVIPAWNEKDQEQGVGSGKELIEAGDSPAASAAGDKKQRRGSTPVHPSNAPGAPSPVDDLLGLSLAGGAGAQGAGGFSGQPSAGAFGSQGGSPAFGSQGGSGFGSQGGSGFGSQGSSPFSSQAGAYGQGGAGTQGGSGFGSQGGSGIFGNPAIGTGALGAAPAVPRGPSPAGVVDLTDPFGLQPGQATQSLSPATSGSLSTNGFNGSMALATTGATDANANALALTVADGSDPQAAKTTAMFKRLCLATEGVLYEDGFLQIGMKSEYQREMGRIMFYYGNSSMTPLTNFTTSITPSSIQFQPQPTASTIAPKAQVQQSVKPVNITLRLPIIVTKFTEPSKLMGPDFFNHWKNYGAKALEAQEVFKVGGPSKAIDMNWIAKVMGEGLHLHILKGVDPSINNIVAAGAFHSATGGTAPSPCLVRLETNPQANMCRLTVRTASATLTTALKNALVTHLS